MQYISDSLILHYTLKLAKSQGIAIDIRINVWYAVENEVFNKFQELIAREILEDNVLLKIEDFLDLEIFLLWIGGKLKSPLKNLISRKGRPQMSDKSYKLLKMCAVFFSLFLGINLCLHISILLEGLNNSIKWVAMVYIPFYSAIIVSGFLFKAIDMLDRYLGRFNLAIHK